MRAPRRPREATSSAWAYLHVMEIVAERRQHTAASGAWVQRARSRSSGHAAMLPFVFADLLVNEQFARTALVGRERLGTLVVHLGHEAQLQSVFLDFVDPDESRVFRIAGR